MTFLKRLFGATKKIEHFDSKQANLSEEITECVKCGGRNFEHDTYWDEYNCENCGWVSKEKPKGKVNVRQLQTPKELTGAMKKIKKVEIYFEPQGAVKMTMELGAQVEIPLQKGIPAAIQTADQILGMGGSLVAYASDKNFNVEVTDEKSDEEWAAFINGKCSKNTKWKRWNGETTQGRWNVIVFLIESSSQTDITPKKLVTESTGTEINGDILEKIWAIVGPTNITLTGPEKITELGDQAVPAAIHILRNPGTDLGIANQALLASALSDFARSGNREAASALKDIVAGSIAIYGPDGESAFRIAGWFVDDQETPEENDPGEIVNRLQLGMPLTEVNKILGPPSASLEGTQMSILQMPGKTFVEYERLEGKYQLVFKDGKLSSINSAPDEFMKIFKESGSPYCSYDFKKLIEDFLKINALKIGSLNEFRKGREDFDEWGKGMLIGSKEWIVGKISSKLEELNSGELNITRARKYELLSSNLDGFSIRIMAKIPNYTIGYYIGRLADDIYGLFGSGFSADENETGTERKKKISNIEKVSVDNESIPIKSKKPNTLYQDIKNKIWEVAGPTNITLRGYDYIVGLGEQAVPAAIDILRNPENQYGMADQVMLVEALVEFAKKENKEAVKVMNEIVLDKVAIYNPYGDAQNIAYNFLSEEKKSG